MDNIHAKEFLDFLLNNTFSEEETKKLIRNYSYFINIMSENYNYNTTYLESYCSKLYKLIKIVHAKTDVFNKLIENIQKFIGEEYLNNLVIIMDDFWKYEKNEIFHNGKIDFSKLSNDKIYIECKYNSSNILKVYYDEYNYNNKEIDNKLLEFTETIKKDMGI